MQTGTPIFQILSVNDTDKILSNNIYCLNAEVGASWIDHILGTEDVVYNKSYNLENKTLDSADSAITQYKGVVDNTNLPQVLWILDNIYIDGDSSKTVKELLAEAGIVEDSGVYYYDKTVNPSSVFSTGNFANGTYVLQGNPMAGGYVYNDTNGQQVNVTLPVEMVQIVQQAAIWYFTNFKTQYVSDPTNPESYKNFDNYTKASEVTPKDWIKYAKKSDLNTVSQLQSYEVDGENGPVHVGKMLQEQADILFNYFIDSANYAVNHGYTGSTEGGITLTFTGGATDPKFTESGENYIVGPLKITTTGTITNLSVSPGTVTDANGNAKTLKANENFYVKIAKSSVTNNNITITASGKSKETQKTLWLKEVLSSANAEQPIVEVKRTETPVSAPINIPIEKEFDLALRKRIYAINGKTTGAYIKNEAGNSATRADGNEYIDKTTIPDTATYKHRKDPVVVKTGDTVTYRIWIYNEGEINGYASEIVDQLPTGMTCALTTVTSNKGTVYTVNYDTTSNKLTLAATTGQAINKFNGTTLSSDYVDVTCTITQTPETDGTTKHYLTNIAYISKGRDTENNQDVTADRDGNESKTTNSPSQTASQLNSTDANSYKGKSSNPSVYNDTNNTTYFAGQEDDDDFEKVVVLPKTFDLALRKFITKINGQNVTTDREPKISNSEVTNLANGNAFHDNGKTAQKTHPKTKLKVEAGDTIIYTIRVYNEGEISGYAAEVTDYLPEGLTLKADSTINTDNGWVAAGQGRAIKTTKLANKLIDAFNSTTIDYEDLQVECIVNENATSSNLKNIAEITQDKDENGNDVTDRDSTPNNLTDAQKSNYNPSTAPNGKGYEDDDDYEDLELKQIDLALRKFISKVSTDGDFSNTQTTTTYNREPQVDTTKLKNGTATTAKYNHSKEPISLNEGDYVLYTIRVYNEGEVKACASKIVDYLPNYLNFVNTINNEAVNTNWVYDGSTIPAKVSTTSTVVLDAFDAANDDGNGSKLKYTDVQIICKVNSNAPENQVLTNIAEITEYKDKNGNVVNKDIDSQPANFPDNKKTNDYNGNGKDGNYIPGQQDDDDFDKVIINEKRVDLALTKFITAVSKDDKIEDGEYITPDKKIGSKTNEYLRATVADTTGLKNGTSTNATYTAKKDIEPLVVGKNEYVLYNIRVYNEGEVDVYAGEITDYLPENLEFVNGEFNTKYGWTANGQIVKTSYLSKANGTDKILKAFDKANDDGKGSGLDYKDLPILCKVSDKAEKGKKLVNTAEITKYEDKNGNNLPKDVDSTPENKPEKNVENRSEDDDDYEVVIIKDFDLALRKFITEIDTTKTQNDKTATTTTNYGREPKLSYENGKIVYTHPKDVLKVHVGDVVIYTLRVFNEGDIAGFAEKISDDIPKYLEYLPDYNTNKEYRWKMYDKDGKETTKVKDAVKIVTDYTSKENGESLMKSKSLTENPNLLNAFDKTKGITDTNPDYVDVKVAFKVKDPNSNKTVITNKAQISEDADENGNPVDDIDSIPDKWNEGEDDQDYENVSVEYFDLSLLKYVTKVMVTENGKTTTTKTGNTGAKTDITPKVEVYRKRLYSTVVKFEFTIKVTNEGDIAGYASELTDYVPKGLKFYASDNKGWKDEGNNVISTTLLKDTLLQPGQSATVKVILRWINGESNLGLKTNVAEISKDRNDPGIPDRDSTPDNKKKGEDDIDDAPVLLTISTGLLEHTVEYAAGALVILVILGLGVVAIKKYVL